MRALIARDLADAAVPGLSADRRFATAYNAALQVANTAIASAGYRVTAKTGTTASPSKPRCSRWGHAPRAMPIIWRRVGGSGT